MATRLGASFLRTALIVTAAAGWALAPMVSTSQPASATETLSMEQAGPTHHAIDYVEFVVTDMASAQAFYATAFDWKFTDYGPDYAGIQAGPGRESGGFRVDTQVVPGGPLVILYSADLDATVASVVAAGGEISIEPFAFPGGRRFHFKDPSGNELAVWSE